MRQHMHVHRFDEKRSTALPSSIESGKSLTGTSQQQGSQNRRGRGYRAPAEVTAVFTLPYPRGKPGNRGNRAVTGGFVNPGQQSALSMISTQKLNRI
uniref:Uncharacterized protein n=1 Tax=Oryza sativa subsp. japonica TaxID=39947 RepID=Q6H665_ORYSJ|nr:hypothetical protein [Oryza sativa Japonica Group]